MHEAEHSLSVQQNLTYIAEDRSRLADVHTGIERLLQEHDPFQFIKVSDSCRGPHLYCPTKAKNCDFTNSETEENHCSGLEEDPNCHLQLRGKKVKNNPRTSKAQAWHDPEAAGTPIYSQLDFSLLKN
ncbi:hypothetical protein SRHO_G00252140 [Serrasalmus rhombeus]